MHSKTGDLECQAAAYMYGQLGYSQNDIKDALDLSQPVVSRLLKEAKRKGWLVESRPQFVAEQFSREKMAEIEMRIVPKPLRAGLHRLIPGDGTSHRLSIRVFPTAVSGTAPSAWDERLEWFGRHAAPYLKDLLHRAKVCGIAWGRTTAAIVKGFNALHIPPPWKKHPVKFIPLGGESLGGTTQFSASSIAASLDALVNGGQHHALSLIGIPALIPEEFSPGEVATIHRLIRQVQAYRTIFSPSTGAETQQEPLVDHIDTILTSAGARPWGYGHSEFVAPGGINREELHGLVIGDICGVLVPRPGLRQAELGKVEQMQTRWTGITREHLQRCVERASGRNSPGVILMAIGASKIDIIYQCVQLGLVNHLVVDQDLARALANKVR
jgi:DNA-binding transcriptional regulator LsrR (DeoR family)